MAGFSLPVAGRLLAILLLAMAAGQLSDIPGFVDVVATYQVGGTTLAWALAVGLVVGEVASGVGLLAAGHARRRRATPRSPSEHVATRRGSAAHCTPP